MLMSLVSVSIIIFVALVFDFLNGFHDAANSIATIVATRVLTPLRAILWAAFFNFVAAFTFGVPVAKTVGGGVVHKELVTPEIVLAGLCGAIFWNILTWYFGLPTSSSHALIGGFAGSALMAMQIKVGSMCNVVNWQKVDIIALYIVLSPLIGLTLGFTNMVIVMWLFRSTAPHRLDSWFRRLQLLSAAAYSLGHGTNDAQKTMGIIAVLLYSAGLLREFEVPFWVVLICHAAIALGTMCGGWRIVKTMGLSITKLKPVGGFCAETAGAATIIGASVAGIPVSTTHTITGAIVGVGATQRLSAVRWGVAGRIVWAWVLTMPMAGLVGAAVYWIIHLGR
ncbi:MAG: anion permease [Armatimonadota bacterium]